MEETRGSLQCLQAVGGETVGAAGELLSKGWNLTFCL